MKIKLLVLVSSLILMLSFEKQDKYYMNKMFFISCDTLDFNKLINKQWVYSHSFNLDTIVKFNKLEDLPINISYYKTKKNNIIDKNNPIFSMWKNNPIKNIYSLHDVKPFGEKSYPYLMNHSKKNNIEKLRIQHYIINKEKFGKGYAYFVNKTGNDTLILTTEKIYYIKGIRTLLKHAYVLNSSQ